MQHLKIKLISLFGSMATQVSQFNTEQQNAMERFNAGEDKRTRKNLMTAQAFK